MNTTMRRVVHASVWTCLTLSLLLAAADAAAQAPSKVVTLEEALQLAESRSEQMTIAKAGVDRADADLTRARSDLFPQLSAAASYDRALASEFEGLFDDAASDGDSGEFGDFEDLPFGRKNTFRFNLSFSQNLFSGGRVGAQTAIADAGRSTAAINLSSTRAQLMLDVVRAYYDAALSERLLVIAEATYKQADATFEQTRLSYQAGSQPEFELLRAQVARDNQRPTIIRSRANRDIAMLRLKQLLEIPANEPIMVTAALEAETLPPPASFAVGVVLVEDTIPTIDRAPVRLAQSSVRQSEGGVDVAKAQRFPTVNLTSSYGEVAYPSTFPVFNDFRRNWTVGAIVQVPILNGGRLRAEEAIARAEVRAAEARLQQARELAQLDTQSAYEELRAAVASWEASAGTVQQAQRAYEIAELRYREGVSTQLELSDSRLLLVQSQATRAQAGRDLQVARARVALLPDLPLETTGAGGLGAGTPLLNQITPQQANPAAQPGIIRALSTGGTAGQFGAGGGIR
jgi:outer membrane protein